MYHPAAVCPLPGEEGWVGAYLYNSSGHGKFGVNEVAKVG